MTKDYAIIHAAETLFFSHHEDQLCQWVLVTIESQLVERRGGTVTIHACGEEAITQLALQPGVVEYRCFAPALWPQHAPVDDATLRLQVGDFAIVRPVAVGHHRPWTAYLLTDACTDYTWVYDSEQAMRADDAALTEAELNLAEATAGGDHLLQSHYNFVHAREVEFYLEHYPQQAARLFGHIRRGNITLNPVLNMSLTADMSLEEMIRAFYAARAWAIQQGLELGYANLQETPTMAWGMAPVLAGSGVRHLVKSVLQYECPWANRLQEPPVYVWEGPDGSQVLVRLRNRDYTEGNFVLRELREVNTALNDQILPGYEQLGAQYPFDAIALVGCYGDLAPNSKDMPARKAQNVAAYNAQGWEYPRLIDAAHRQFWNDIERQITARSIQLPVLRGDYGISWETWPASLAYDFAGWRRAQERAATADRLAAILSQLAPSWYESHCPQLAQGWQDLLSLSDHAWNGANDANRVLNATLRRRWQTSANEAFDTVISTGLAALGRCIPTGDERRMMVFNALGWARTGVVRVEGLEPGALILGADGAPIPSQTAQEDGRPARYFVAAGVPSLGYRTYTVAADGGATSSADIAADQGWVVDGARLEGPFYAVEVSPISGGLSRIYDKQRGKELVDAASPYHANQCVYLSDGVEHTPAGAQIELTACGPVFAELTVRTALKNTRLVSVIRLYRDCDRIDIRNELDKLPTAEKQELDFIFPFNAPERQLRLETPGAIITPGCDQRPGSGQALSAVRHFVDLFNDEFGVLLSQADSGLVAFGHRTTLEDPAAPDPSNGTVYAVALQNLQDWHEATRDQAGAAHFVFRYSLRGHAGGADPAAGVQFGWEDNNELLAQALAKGQPGDLPADVHSFLRVEPANLILTSLKAAEEEGLIARLWECAGGPVEGRLQVAGLGGLQSVSQTDLLERDDHPLMFDEGGIVPLAVRGCGLATLRLGLGHASGCA